MSETSTGRSAQFALIGSIVLTVLLFYVPYGHLIGRPLLWLSTLAHEMGHGLAAMMVGGTFESFVMFPDGSGVATHSGDLGSVRRALVSAGGLVGPAIAAVGCFLAARREAVARSALVLLGVGLLVAEVMVVNNLFGFVFVGALAVVCFGLSVLGRTVSQWALMFGGVQLALSVYSRSDYLFTPVANTATGAHPSDVANMASALGGPYWFWGGVCGGFSALVLLFGVIIALRR